MRKTDRELAIFVHIYKNSGTTVTQQMKRHYGEAGLRRENDGAVDGVKFVDRIRAALLEDRTRAVVGHFKFHRIAKVLTEIGAGPARFFSFVRDPVPRAVSIYRYSRALESARHHALARDLDLNAFLETLMDDSAGPITNHQACCLSADGTRSFDAARQSIRENFAFVGLSDRLEATNTLARSSLGLAFDGALRANVSAKGAGLAQIAAATLARLQSLNTEDQRLYDFVRASLPAAAVGASVNA